MTENLGFTSEDFMDKEVSAENTETTETTEIETKSVEAESTTEAKAESTPEEGELKATKEGEDSGAESPTEEFKPDFSYKVKDKEHEFPEWLKGVVTDKDKESHLRDLFTKVDAFDGIKDARDTVETNFNNYQQSVQNEIFPILDNVKEFDTSIALKDFGKAFEVAQINPTDVVDYMMMDENLSQLVAQKFYEQMQLEEAGPQALEAKRNNWEEQNKSRKLELENSNMEARLKQMEETTFNQVLDFSLNQNAAAVNSFDSINGAGAFKGLVTNMRAMKPTLNAGELINETVTMLGLNGQVSTQGTNENSNEQLPKVTPQESKQPAALPNLGTGANVSMVQKQATSWDDWEKGMGTL